MKNSNNEKIILKFKSDLDVKNSIINDETLTSINNDIDNIKEKIIKIKLEINNCKSMQSFDNIDINYISETIGFIRQASIILKDKTYEKSIEELNQLYRSLEILYFDKKIEILKITMDKIVDDSERNMKDLTSGTLFSIASVFLGISLTSALVTGVEYVGSNFILLYFMTCLLITVFSIGLASIFMRKYDDKSIVITVIIAFVSFLWLVTAYYSYNDYDVNDNHCEKKDNIIISQDLNIGENGQSEDLVVDK